MGCCCDPQKIDAVHAYLREQVPDCALDDFHAPTRLMHAGLPPPYAEHHVVRLRVEGVLPYYTVLLDNFLACSLAAVALHVRTWVLADALRMHRVAVVSDSGVSPL